MKLAALLASAVTRPACYGNFGHRHSDILRVNIIVEFYTTET